MYNYFNIMENFKVNVLLLIDQRSLYSRTSREKHKEKEDALNKLEKLVLRYCLQWKALPQMETKFFIDSEIGDCWDVYTIHVTDKEIDVCLEN